MATPRDIGDYGGPFENDGVVQDPTTEQDASDYNRQAEDCAQMTRTSEKWDFTFITDSGAAPLTVSAANVSVLSHAGSGASAKPVVTKSGTGLYLATCPATFTDGLAASETVSFSRASGSVMSTTAFGHVQCTVSSNAISIAIVDLAAVATDLSGTTTIRIVAK
jgi:hypothetical protein